MTTATGTHPDLTAWTVALLRDAANELGVVLQRHLHDDLPVEFVLVCGEEPPEHPYWHYFARPDQWDDVVRSLRANGYLVSEVPASPSWNRSAEVRLVGLLRTARAQRLGLPAFLS